MATKVKVLNMDHFYILTHPLGTYGKSFSAIGCRYLKLLIFSVCKTLFFLEFQKCVPNMDHTCLQWGPLYLIWISVLTLCIKEERLQINLHLFLVSFPVFSELNSQMVHIATEQIMNFFNGHEQPKVYLEVLFTSNKMAFAVFFYLAFLQFAFQY